MDHFESLSLKVAHYCKVRHIGQINREAPTHLPAENRYYSKANSGMRLQSTFRTENICKNTDS